VDHVGPDVVREREAIVQVLSPLLRWDTWGRKERGGDRALQQSHTQ
jgi:hypothetical protein